MKTGNLSSENNILYDLPNIKVKVNILNWYNNPGNALNTVKQTQLKISELNDKWSQINGARSGLTLKLTFYVALKVTYYHFASAH